MLDRRRSATFSTLRARGRHALPWLRRNRANRWKVLLAPAILGAALLAYPAFAGANYYVSTTGHDASSCTSAETPCLTIAGAIAKASAGDTIIVASGTYHERDIAIGKSLTLVGDPGDSAPGPGAAAPVIDGDGDTSTDDFNDGFKIADGVSNVTISGFVIENLKSTPNDNDGTGVGVHGYVMATSNITVSDNRFRNLGYGVLAGNDSEYGLGTHTSWSVTDNIFEGFLIGAELTDASNSYVSDNVFHMTDHMIGDTEHHPGVAIFSYIRTPQTNLTISGNTIDGDLADAEFAQAMFPSGGYPAILVWPRNNDQDATLANLTISNNDLSGLTGTAPRIFLLDSKPNSGRPLSVGSRILTATVTNNRFGAADKAFATDPSAASAVNSQAVAVAATIVATQNYWGQASGPVSGQAVGHLTTSPWISTYTPDAAKAGAPGFWPTAITSGSTCTSTCYVAKTGSDGNPGSLAFPFLTIQKALDTVSVSGTVQVAAGTYVEDLTISKALTLRGPNYGVAAGPLAGAVALRAPEAIVEGSSSFQFFPGDLDPAKAARLFWPGAKVTADDVVIDGMKFARPTLAARADDARLVSAMTGGIHTIIRNSVFDLSVGNLGTSTGCGSAISSGDGQTDLATRFTILNSAFTWHRYQLTPTCYNGNGSRVIYLDSASPSNLIEGNYFFQTAQIYVTDSADATEIRDNRFSANAGTQVTIGADDVRVADNVFDLSGSANGFYSDEADDLTVEGNQFTGGGTFHVSVRRASDITIRGNSFANLPVNPAIWAGWVGSPSVSGLVIKNNTFASNVVRAFYQCFADGTAIQLNDIASPGPSGAGDDQYKPIQNGGTYQSNSCSGTRSLDASLNYWHGLSSPAYNAAGWTTTTSPEIASYVLDPTRSAQPGFWPKTTTLSLGTIMGPTTVPLGNSDLGNASVQLSGADPGTTIDVSAPDVSELPADVTPFKVDGATLIEITVSAGAPVWPVSVCLNGTRGVDKLWHYESGDWVDITDRVIAGGSLPDPYPGGQVCGMTNSFSPFALAEEQDPDALECTLTDNRLDVPLASGETLNVARDGSNLWVGSTEVWCGATAWQIGGTTGKVNILNITGASGNETVVFLKGTATNWGANSAGPSTLKRQIALGGGTSDRVVIRGTEFGDALTAATFPSDAEIYRFEGGAGSDTLTGSAVIDEFVGDAGADVFKGGSGNDCADYSAQTLPISADLTRGTAGNLTVGTDTLSSIECVKGGSAGDTLSGSAYGDFLYGSGGDDTLQGRGGADVLSGGADTDLATYAEQTYAVQVHLAVPKMGVTGSEGSSTGAAGLDSLDGIENLTGGTASDLLVGNASANRLVGGAGADVLVGLAGDDTFDGGTGVDTVSYDDVAYTGAAGGSISVSLATLDTPIDTDGDGDGEESGTGAGSDTFVSAAGVNTIENLTGSSYADALTGTGVANIINGLGGGDTVNAGGGNDIVNGGAGGDSLNGEAGADTIKGGADGDTMNGGAGADAISGEAGDDTLCGGLDGDTLRGGDDNDTLVGGAVLGGGTGVDVMYGDNGDGDTISYDNTVCSGGGAESGAITFRLGSVGTQQKTVGAGIDVNGGGVENLTGGSGNDILVGDAKANVIRGLAGDDTMQGGDGNDTIYSGAGTANRADGQAGTDTCYGDGAGGGWAALQPVCDVKLT